VLPKDPYLGFTSAPADTSIAELVIARREMASLEFLMLMAGLRGSIYEARIRLCAALNIGGRHQQPS